MPDCACCSLHPRLLFLDEGAALNESVLELVARMVGWCEPPRADGAGHPPAGTMRVLATLRRFLREGTPGTASPCLPPADRFAMARPAGDGHQREQVHLAAAASSLGANRRAAARSLHAGRHAARAA